MFLTYSAQHCSVLAQKMPMAAPRNPSFLPKMGHLGRAMQAIALGAMHGTLAAKAVGQVLQTVRKAVTVVREAVSVIAATVSAGWGMQQGGGAARLVVCLCVLPCLDLLVRYAQFTSRRGAEKQSQQR